ncbi:MAG: CHAD domain-containing protein [Phycisphaerae bacterium]|nr:CHAD domain-containing protein [Phycisphaerae bacterium]
MKKPGKTEIETKFLLRNARELARVPAALVKMCDRVRPRGTILLLDSYVDTADWWFFRAGLACRIRRQRSESGKAAGAKAWLVLKELSRAPGGISSRMELDEPLAARNVPGTPVRALPAGKLGDRLRSLLGGRAVRTLFDIENRRTVTHVVRDGAAVEVAADEVTFRAGGKKSRRLAEVELESLTGSAKGLASLRDTLARRLNGRPARQSKFQIGLRLAGLTPPRVRRIGQLRLSAGGTTRAAACAIVGLLFGQILWSDPGVRLGLGDEPVHQMRVACRRLRAALRIFREALGQRLTESLHEELSSLCDTLGAVRDLDVYIASLPEDAKTAATIRHYRARLERQRAVARAHVFDRLNGPVYASLIRRLRRLVSAAGARPSNPAAREPIAAFARRKVRGQLKRLLRRGRTILANRSDSRLHKLRLSIKRLRYTCEFVQSLFGRPMTRFIARLVDMQDALGRLRDATVSGSLLAQFAKSLAGRRAAQACVERLARSRGKIARRQRAEFAGLWSRFDQKQVRRALKTALSD